MSAIFKCNDDMTKSIEEQAREYRKTTGYTGNVVYVDAHFIAGAKARDAEIEQLKVDLRMSDLNRQSLWVDSLKLVDENAALKSKLKIAKDALEEIAYSGSSREFCTRVCEQTLSEIGGEI